MPIKDPSLSNNAPQMYPPAHNTAGRHPVLWAIGILLGIIVIIAIATRNMWTDIPSVTDQTSDPQTLSERAEQSFENQEPVVVTEQSVNAAFTAKDPFQKSAGSASSSSGSASGVTEDRINKAFGGQ